MDFFDNVVSEYDIDEYLVDNCVLINKPSTYPKQWLEFLSQHKKLIRNFRYVETFNFNAHERAKIEGRDCSRIHEKNKFTEDYNSIVDEFADMILSSNMDFLCFHATRLTNNEIESIKKNGLRTFDCDSVFEYKYKPLYENGYITKDELNELKRLNLLKNQFDRAKLIYLRVGYNDIKFAKDNKTGNYNLYNNYGGEITYSNLENTPLGNKLKDISYPCSIILKIKCNKNECHDMAGKILQCINTQEIRECAITVITNKDKIPVLDVIKVDEKSRLVSKFY